MKSFAILLIILLGNIWIAPSAGASAETFPAQGSTGAPIILEGDLTASGSTLFSIPLDLGSMDVGQWLLETGLSPAGIHGWSPLAQQYAPLKTLRPGEGFLLAKGPGKVSVQGQRVVDAAVELPLEKGWNLVGMPFETAIPIAALQIHLAGVSKSYNSAVEKKWVGAVNTLVDGQMRQLAVDGSAMLEPWRGYWFYAYQPCRLHIPSAESLAKSKGGKKKPAKP